LVLLNAMRLLWFERAATSPAVQRWQARLLRVNDWMEHRLDVDEAVHWLGHHLRPVLGVLGLLLVVGYALSGLTQIGPDEVGVVRRFGRALPDDLEPGLHWRWPWPVETVNRVQPGRIRTIEIGFRTTSGSPAATAARAWSSPHGNDGLVRVPDEAVLITGDGNLVEMQGSVRYTVAHPHAYLFDAQDPEAIVRAAAESVLRERVAATSFGELLTTDRETLQRQVLQRLRERCADYGPEGMGVTVEGFSLHDLHPPQEVVRAYHDVTNAMENRDRRVNQAEAEVLARVRAQEADDLQIVRRAEAARDDQIRMAEARLAAFQARYDERSRLPLALPLSLFGDACRAVWRGQPAEQAGKEYQRRLSEALAVQAMLTDFRLYWDMLAAALVGRDKVFIDSDKVPGRRTLWMLPFEPPRPVMPDRGPRPGPRDEP
jgi:regulator of protease activity HflC (stomatin/prohibitin superfamily)